MFYGTRSVAPLGVGFIAGLVASILFSSAGLVPLLPSGVQGYYQACHSIIKRSVNQFVDNSESWKVNVLKSPTIRVNSNDNDDAKRQFVRSRFAATELGIREKLIVIVLGQSSLSVALNASIGQHVPRLHLFAEQSRIDVDMSALAENLSPYRPDGQHAHVHILNTIFNKSMHENYDFFLFVPDSTYVNPFRLMDFVNSKSFHIPSVYGIPDERDQCVFSAGILVSNPIVRSLIQQRHVCTSIVANSDEKAFEMCLHRAANVSCVKDDGFRWWRTDDNAEAGAAIHDRIGLFSTAHGFNDSITVSKLLSDVDVVSLHDHFIDVERARIEREIEQVSKDLDAVSSTIPKRKTWPKAMPPSMKPPNRYQVPFWEYFTETDIFKIEPHQNVHPLVGNDAIDIREVVTAARKLIEPSVRQSGDFVRLRNGYRLFNAMRGMEYVVDLEYQGNDVVETERVVLCRPIHVTQLVPTVPYVKEDTDVTLVIPVGSAEHVIPVRALLVRHLRMCKLSISGVDNRRTRLVIAVRGISALNVRQLSNDLIELKKRCKSMQMETAVLVLKPNSALMVEMAAMDEAIDHYGQQTVYALLSPYADYQREFLDRIRLNSIRHFQVFVPIPFAEYSPKIVTADHALSAKPPGSVPKNEPNTHANESLRDRITRLNDESTQVLDHSRPIVVHKNNGFFDTNEFSTVAMYGADYVNMRPRLMQRIVDGELVLDLSLMFLGQSDIHVLRAIEPSLKLRYHLRSCPNTLTNADFTRCSLSQKQAVGSKAQLADVVFNDLEDLSVLSSVGK
uniref:Hexosyltransferase n=1 Tax=Panagrellus redivivus TaxID=6233 RepID=A0A7E4VLA0_PANRE